MAVNPRRVLAVLVASGDLARAQHHGNFMRLLEGITAECDGVGALASLHTLPPSAEGLFGGDPERTPAIVRDRHCDAVIVTGNLPAEDIALLARLAPTITLSRVYDGITADAVIADNLHGIRMLVRHLVSLGHRRLAFVSDTYEASFFAERRAGFFAGCVEAGIAPDDRTMPAWDIPGGGHDHDWADRIVALSRSGITAFVCANDLTAFRTMAVLEAAGISIPGDASVTGFDRVVASTIPLPFDPPQRALTTLDPNFAEMGRCAVRLALQRLTLAAVPPLRLTVAGNLVEGDTAGRLMS